MNPSLRQAVLLSRGFRFSEACYPRLAKASQGSPLACLPVTSSRVFSEEE